VRYEHRAQTPAQYEHAVAGSKEIDHVFASMQISLEPDWIILASEKVLHKGIVLTGIGNPSHGAGIRSRQVVWISLPPVGKHQKEPTYLLAIQELWCPRR
jgi:hypothetical protein